LLGLTIAACPAAAQERGRGGRGAAVTLPDGPGKDVVQAQCASCHALNLIANSGYSRAEWISLFTTMVALPQDQTSTVADYLAKNFPEKPRPPAVIIPGDASISIKEWLVPSLGSRPHDPLATPDGSIWWTGQFASVIGRLDPKTGAMKEFKTKTPASGPHGLTADKDGNIWFTGNFKAYVGKLDPKTGEVTEYPTSDPAARDPHTPIFDQKGTLWFTLQGANMVGRLNPKTGEMKLVTSPTPRSNPYGMVVSSKGVPFFVEFGANKVASIDPESMTIKEYVLPAMEARPRRVAITSDDVIWYSDYARGYLGRLDPKTGAVKEWPSPGGPKSLPYGITSIRDVIWYSESGVKPNTVVRFDPKTEKFQTWAIPSGGGVVRNVSVTRDGNLALACSGVNRVALVEIKDPPRKGAANWAPPRTPWGEPDLQGTWTDETITPFERPTSLAGKAFLTEEEAASLERQAAEQRERSDGASRPGDVGNYNQFWFDSGTKVVATRRTSLVVDPPDGRVPVRPEAEKIRDASDAQNTDSPEFMSPWDRCITRGVPGGFFPAGYNNGYQILQTPGYVVILYEMIHAARVIPIGGRAHLPSAIRFWDGDSIGRWDGNTLVVDVTNYNGQGWIATNAAAGRIKGIPQSDALHVVERFTRAAADTIQYEVTVDDPKMYTKPWKVSIPLERNDGYSIYEYACHEGNHAVEDVLRGGRAKEREKS
jgi:virginiamycin B lyase